MPGDPRLRAADADREKTAALLREHHAVGRLTADEFNERLDQVYAAKTLGELDALLADLPAIDLYQPPSASIRPGPSGRRSGRRREGPGANLDRSAGNGLARLDVGRVGWAGVATVAVLAWVGLALASGGAAAWLVWFLVIFIPVAVAAGLSRRRSRPLSGPWRCGGRRQGSPGTARFSPGPGSLAGRRRPGRSSRPPRPATALFRRCAQPGGAGQRVGLDRGCPVCSGDSDCCDDCDGGADTDPSAELDHGPPSGRPRALVPGVPDRQRMTTEIRYRRRSRTGQV